jgi:hypothetical protein
MRSIIALATMLLGLLPLASQVRITETDEAVHVFVADKPVLTYNTDTVQPPEGVERLYERSGFIHPLYSPSGKVLTDAFPIGHVHQHAIFNAWTRTTFKHEVVDFWNQHGGTGTVKHSKLGSVKDNSFEAELQQVSLKQGPALKEEWEIKVKDSRDPFIIDLEIEQECATENEVYLHPYHYGGLAFRGSGHWSPEDEARYEGSMKVLTGEGVSSIEDSNHTRPKWIAVYGKIEQAQAGFVVMDHPSNFRYPQSIRVHPRMPYFVFSPVIDGSFIIKPRVTYQANYRIITFDGEPDVERIEAWYKDFVRGNAKK